MAEEIEEILLTGDVDLHIPALCDVEVASGLRGLLRSSTIAIPRADEAIADYLNLPLTRHGHQALMPRILDLRENVSAYDATYLALGELLEGELVTADRHLARAARAHTRLGVSEV